MNSIQKRMLVTVALATTTLLLASIAVGDPLVGRDVLKFSQQPMDATRIVDPIGATQIFWGHDESSTAYSPSSRSGQEPYRGRFMADDFADKFSTPIVHVKWWGSYLNNSINQGGLPVDKFLISFERDIPADPNDPNSFSRPGDPLLNQIVRRGPLVPGSGTYTEAAISAGGPPLGETLYEYNAELHLGKEFFQQPDTVYWLKIVALVDLPQGLTIDPLQPPTNVPRWGWHNRDYTIMNPLASTPPAVSPGEHLDGSLSPLPGGAPIWHFQDDAVTGIVRIDHLSPAGQIMPVVAQTGYQPTRYLAGADGPRQIERFSKDLAFELYTVPEPTSCLLLSVGLAGVLMHRRRSCNA